MSLYKELISPNKITLFLFHLLITALWFIPFAIGKVEATNSTITILGTIKLLSLSPIKASIVQFLFFLFIGIIFINQLEQIKFFSARTFLPYFLFLFGMSVTKETHFLNNTSFGFFFLMLAIFQILKMFQSEAIFRAFNSMLFLNIAILFQQEYLFFIPFFWIGFILLRAFTARIFWASLFGIVLIIFTVFSLSYITNNMDIPMMYFSFNNFHHNFLNFNNFSYTIINLIFNGIFLFYLIFFIVGDFSHHFGWNIATRIYYIFSFFLLIYFFLIYFIQYNFIEHLYIPILFMNAIFASIFYNFKQKRFSKIVLYSFPITGITYWILSIFF